MIAIGYVRYIYDQDYDPSDPTNGYTAYEFFPVNGQMGMDWQRRESIQVIPGLDSVLDGNGRIPGPQDRRDFSYTFRLHVSDGDLDAAYDKLAAVVAPGYPVRLVYTTDANIKAGGTNYWYTTAYNASIRHTRTSANYYGGRGDADFVVTWRIRPDWRPRFSQASDIWGNNDGVWGTSDGLWGQGFFVSINANPLTFTIDNTGTAGLDLPTLPDTSPVITIDGGAGGDAGLQIENTTAMVRDTTGTLQTYRFTIPKVPVGSQAVLDFARGRFTLGGASIRPTKPNYQPYYLPVLPGKVNSIRLTALGANVLTSGTITFDWFKKRA